MNFKSLFTFENIFKLLLIILPFHVIISVFFQYKLEIWWIKLYKELLLVILWFLMFFEIYKKWHKLKLDKLDYLIISYFLYLILISIVNFSWFKAILYWWWYDFEFLLVFLITRNWSALLSQKLGYYLKLFLISSWIAIILWILVRFVFGEQILTYIWFSSNLSNWSIIDWPPIYHWVEWANVRRFQWIFDWPNQAAFFLILFSWVLYHYYKKRKETEFYLYFSLFIVFWLVFLTYTRSALIWIIWSLVIIFILNFKLLLKKYIKQTLSFIVVMLLLWGAFYVRYWWSMWEIVWRASSTKWHFERMIIWFNQFTQKPLGRWLASSWPAYRFAHNTKWVDEKNFIPESWYIQQLVEWWIIWFCLFMAIIVIIWLSIYKLSIAMFFSFWAILAMNVLLHTFEASYISMLLFMILWLFLRKK